MDGSVCRRARVWPSRLPATVPSLGDPLGMEPHAPAPAPDAVVRLDQSSEVGPRSGVSGFVTYAPDDGDVTHQPASGGRTAKPCRSPPRSVGACHWIDFSAPGTSRCVTPAMSEPVIGRQRYERVLDGAFVLLDLDLRPPRLPGRMALLSPEQSTTSMCAAPPACSTAPPRAGWSAVRSGPRSRSDPRRASTVPTPIEIDRRVLGRPWARPGSATSR